MTTQSREKLVEAIAEELNASAEKWTQTQLEISVSDGKNFNLNILLVLESRPKDICMR